MGEDDTSRNRRPVKTIRFPWASGVVKKKAQKRSGVGSHRRVREEEVEEEEEAGSLERRSSSCQGFGSRSRGGPRKRASGTHSLVRDSSGTQEKRGG